MRYRDTLPNNNVNYDRKMRRHVLDWSMYVWRWVKALRTVRRDATRNKLPKELEMIIIAYAGIMVGPPPPSTPPCNHRYYYAGEKRYTYDTCLINVCHRCGCIKYVNVRDDWRLSWRASYIIHPTLPILLPRRLPPVSRPSASVSRPLPTRARKHCRGPSGYRHGNVRRGWR